jgi:16S rRNA (adenine1518-N6/adenine1519-N6)-dimethyltransferase
MSRFPLANKQFGQHFLHSKNVISKITGPLPAGSDCIIEVGPGPAVLTPTLKSYGLPLFVIEMDQRFVELLSPVVGEEFIFRQDALEFNWPHFLTNHSYENIWLVSNLPYNVSVPLTLNFLVIRNIKSMTLMYQKEVAEKIHPKKIQNSMNSLHALCYSQFEIEHVVYAPPGAFVPPPKVESQVLYFKRRNDPLVELKEISLFESFLRITFAQKRKQLGGILKNAYGGEKSTYMLSKAQVQPNLRAESLNFNQILSLFKASLI